MPSDPWLQHLRTSARANRLANHRLALAMAPLSDEEFNAPRVSFFPSLAATLNHILAVDIYYIAGMRGEADMAAQYDAFVPCRSVAEWARRQATSDDRLIALCDGLDPAAAARTVPLDRRDHVDRNSMGSTLAHVFMHQTHHRGQVHAMLAGTSVEPPQLDEFLLPADAVYRVADMAALGWTEAQLMGDAAQSPG
ncbi:DinB family protein [Ideonella sp.]|uniref:DinB family protein n=1 Tax=Ideonella sp. TaxID=1929293 RepID=UPI0035B4BBE3